jgi:hypothetical protein
MLRMERYVVEAAQIQFGLVARRARELTANH